MHAWAVVIHKALLDPSDVEQFGGFSVMTPVRSILDAAAAGTEIDQEGQTETAPLPGPSGQGYSPWRGVPEHTP